MRATLVQILAGITTGATIIEVPDYLQLAAAMKAAAVDHVLLDLMMPGLRNWRTEVPGLIAAMHPTRVIVISGLDEVDFIRRLIDAGIVGFIPKFYESQKLVNTLRFILEGGSYVPSEILCPAPGAPLSWGGRITCRPTAALTPRQKDVLSLVGQGLPNKEIARRLVLSEATIKAHLNIIYRALGVNNRTEAALAARSFAGAAGDVL